MQRKGQGDLGRVDRFGQICLRLFGETDRSVQDELSLFRLPVLDSNATGAKKIFILVDLFRLCQTILTSDRIADD